MQTISNKFRLALFTSVLATSVIALGAAGCGGGGSQKPPPPAKTSRNLNGKLSAATSNLKTFGVEQSATMVSCADQKIVCTNYDGEDVVAEVNDDCSYKIELALDQIYFCGVFSTGGEYLAEISCSTQGDSDDHSIPVFPGPDDSTDDIEVGETPIQEGHVNGNVICDNVDQDNDGVSDLDDNDDDGDGLSDAEDDFNETGCEGALEVDENGNDVPDIFEASWDNLTDTDGDDIPNFCDDDADGDGQDNDVDTDDDNDGTTDEQDNDDLGDGNPDGPSLDFEVGKDGFSFENYGDAAGVTHLTPAELRRAFGDQVCASAPADDCTLTPAAKEWMDENNNSMKGGHCEGFAVLSSLFFGEKKPLSDFGQVENTFGLALTNNTLLQREIAYWFATQSIPNVSKSEVKTSPNEVLDTLNASFAADSITEYYVLGIYKKGYTGGHAVTPYAVQDMGEGKWRIVVYDNNFPNTERYIEVDRNANTWKYIASTNPSEPEGLYEGDANSKTISLAPTLTRLGQFDCPFCGKIGADGKPAASSVNEVQLWTQGNGNVVAKDNQNKQVGTVNGEVVNEIPGARVQGSRTGDLWNDQIEPVYMLPSDSPYTVTLTNDDPMQVTESSISLIGPGYTFGVEKINLDPMQADTIVMDPTEGLISYETSSEETPNIELGITTDDADYQFSIYVIGDAQGQKVELDINHDQGQLKITVTGSGASRMFDIEMHKITATGEEVFKHSGNTAETVDSIILEYAAWQGEGTDLLMKIDDNNNGTFDQDVQLVDQP